MLLREWKEHYLHLFHSSIGYGYGGKGVAALASMLQSCALGLSVVNIDNGIGAGAIAGNIANRASKN